jgi:hypothetical protein
MLAGDGIQGSLINLLTIQTPVKNTFPPAPIVLQIGKRLLTQTGEDPILVIGLNLHPGKGNTIIIIGPLEQKGMVAQWLQEFTLASKEIMKIKTQFPKRQKR